MEDNCNNEKEYRMRRDRNLETRLQETSIMKDRRVK